MSRSPESSEHAIRSPSLATVPGGETPADARPGTPARLSRPGTFARLGRAARAALLGSALTASALPAAPQIAQPAPPGPAAGVPGLETASPDAAVRRAAAEAAAFVEAGEPQAAESRYRDALQEGWLLLGELRAADGDLAGATAAFERAVGVAAPTRRPRTSLALVRLEQGEPAEAARLLRQIVTRHPADGHPRRLLAQALVADGRVEEAVEELAEAHAAFPEDGEITYALATGQLGLGRIEAAAELFAALVAARPRPETRVLIGRTWRDYGEHERARAELEAALAMNPETRRARYYLGTLVLQEKGQDGLAEAIGLFERELALAAPGEAPDPMTSFYLGSALAEDRRFEEALAHLEAASEWPPIRLDAWRYIGRSHLGLGRDAPAAAALERALELAETDPVRPRQLSTIHYQLGSALRRLGEAERAARHLELAREASGDVVEAERERFASPLPAAAASLEAGATAPSAGARFAGLEPEARRRFREGLVTALGHLYLDLGVLTARTAGMPRAVAAFEAAAELAPDLPRLGLSLGSAYLAAGRFERAAEVLEEALREAPRDREAARALALASLNLGDYARAAELLADDPGRDTDRSLAYAYALALVRSGRPGEAEGVFARLLEEHGDWPDLHVVLGQAHAARGDFDAAAASLERALALDPRVAGANATLGEIHLRQGELGEAETALRAELEHHPRDLAARFQLATVLDLASRAEEAAAELSSLLAARPGHPGARYLLGKILLAEGDAGAALPHLEAAVERAPADASARYQLARAYRRLGRTDAAGEQLAVYRELKREEREEVP